MTSIPPDQATSRYTPLIHARNLNTPLAFILIFVASSANAHAGDVENPRASIGLRGRGPNDPVKSDFDLDLIIDDQDDNLLNNLTQKFLYDDLSPRASRRRGREAEEKAEQQAAEALAGARGVLYGGLIRFSLDQGGNRGEVGPANENPGPDNTARIVAAADPFVAFELEVTNPRDEDWLIDFAASAKIVTPASRIDWAAETTLEVVDTGGAPGASAVLSQLYFVGDEDGSNLILSGGFPTLNALPGNPQVGEVALVNEFVGDTIESLETIFTVTISPGDTVHVRGFLNSNNEDVPLLDPARIGRSLDLLPELEAALIVPEPTSSTIVLSGLAICLGVKRRQTTLA